MTDPKIRYTTVQKKLPPPPKFGAPVSRDLSLWEIWHCIGEKREIGAVKFEERDYIYTQQVTMLNWKDRNLYMHGCFACTSNMYNDDII